MDLQTVLRTGPFDAALRAAIDAKGLALQRIQHRLAEQGLRIGVATLSCWQSGQRRPERPESLRAVTELEKILGLPPASLTVLLGPPRPRGPAAGLPAGSRRYDAIFEPASALNQMLHDLDSSADGKLHILGMYEEMLIGPDGGGRLRRCLQVVQAHQEVDRYITIFSADPGCDPAQVSVRAVSNCRLGRVRRDTESRLFIAELLFDQVVRLGETHVFEYEYLDGSGVTCLDYHRGFRFPVGQFTLQIRFHPDALPIRCHRYSRRHVSGPPHDRHELTLSSHRTVHLAQTNVAPGIHGIHWVYQ